MKEIMSKYVDLHQKARLSFKEYLDNHDKNKLNESIDIICMAINIFKNDRVFVEIHEFSFIKYEVIKMLYPLAGEIYAHIDKKKSLEYFQEYQLSLFNCLKTSDMDGFQNSNEVFVYKFRKCSDYLYNDLRKRQITLSKPGCMNDPFDSLYNLWSEPENLNNITKDKEHLELLHKSFDYYRFCSFCVEKDPAKPVLENLLMWSHYADEHKGICIKYKLTGDCISINQNDESHLHLVLRKVDCIKDKQSIETKEITIKEAFLLKAECWEYEQEARLISYDSAYEDDRLGLAYGDNISIDSIFFGIRCSLGDKEKIKSIVGDNVYYDDMKPNYKDIFKLEYNEL